MPHPPLVFEGNVDVSGLECRGIWPLLAQVLAEYKHLEIQCAALCASSAANVGSGGKGMPPRSEGYGRPYDVHAKAVSKEVGTDATRKQMLPTCDKHAEQYSVKVVVNQVKVHEEPRCELNLQELQPCAWPQSPLLSPRQAGAESKDTHVAPTTAPNHDDEQPVAEGSTDRGERSGVHDRPCRNHSGFLNNKLEKEQNARKHSNVAQTIHSITTDLSHFEEDFRGASICTRLRYDLNYQNLVIETGMAFVILLNAICIGVSADVARDHAGWIYLEIFFAICFVSERAFRFFTVGCRTYFFGSDWKWNVVETSLLFLSLIEVAMGLSTMGRTDGKDEVSFSLIRVVRLARIAKIIRVLRLEVFKDLMVMVQSLIGGIRTLFWSMVLISIPLYCVSLVLRETAGNLAHSADVGTESFATVHESFFTTFRCVVAGDCSTKDGRPVFVLLSAAHGYGYALVYSIFLMFMMFGLFNVIAASYVENMIAAAKYNELVQKHNRLQDAEMFNSKIQQLLALVHSVTSKKKRDGDVSQVEPYNMDELMHQHITPDLFGELCNSARFTTILEELDVSEENRMNLFDTLDVDGGGSLDLHELIRGISKLRGDPRRADIIEVGLMLRSLQASFQQFEHDMRKDMLRFRLQGENAPSKA